MYGDPTVIRRLAAGLREQAGDIRREADRLVARTDEAGWLGLAGHALRGRVRQRAVTLRRSAALHDEAADALDRHAREVERLERLVEEIEHRARHLLEEARDGIGGLLNAARDWVSGFDPPPRGSRLWLDVEVPRP